MLHVQFPLPQVKQKTCTILPFFNKLISQQNAMKHFELNFAYYLYKSIFIGGSYFNS